MTEPLWLLLGIALTTSLFGWLVAFYFHRRSESISRDLACVQHQNHSNHATFIAMKQQIAFLEGKLSEIGPDDGEEWKVNGQN